MMTDHDNQDVGPVAEFETLDEPKDMRDNVFYEYEEANSDDEMSRSNIEQAIPVEKLKNGANNAYEFLSWGMQSLKQQAAKVNEKLEESENFRKLQESYQANVKPSVDSAVEGANSLYEKSKPKLAEIGESANNLIEKTKPKLNEISTNAQEGFHNLVEKSGPAIQSMKGSLEACKPTLVKAKENASAGLEKAYESTKNIIEGIGSEDRRD